MTKNGMHPIIANLKGRDSRCASDHQMLEAALGFRGFPSTRFFFEGRTSSRWDSVEFQRLARSFKADGNT